MTPSTVHSIVNEFLSYDGVSVDERTDSYCVRVVKPPECIVEILIPRHRLEWFVTVIEPTTEDQILNDWMDHYSTGSESATELEMEMRHEISNLLKAIVGNPTRLEIQPRKTLCFGGTEKLLLQYESKEGWKTILPFQING